MRYDRRFCFLCVCSENNNYYNNRRNFSISKWVTNWSGRLHLVATMIGAATCLTSSIVSRKKYSKNLQFISFPLTNSPASARLPSLLVTSEEFFCWMNLHVTEFIRHPTTVLSIHWMMKTRFSLQRSKLSLTIYSSSKSKKILKTSFITHNVLSLERAPP